MNANIEILRGELERLFSLEELCTMSASLLGLRPEEVGGHTAKASFARALTERCVDTERLEALLDVLVLSKKELDPRVRDVASLLGEAEMQPGKSFGPYTVDKKLGASEMGVVYQAKRDGGTYILKTLRREASRDRRAVQRFLTANRLVSKVEHPGIPRNVDAGEIEGTFYVAYENIDAQPLSARFARTGPSHINELRPILKGTLEALAALHRAGLQHGDLKMDHCLIARGAEPQTMKVWLIDFGGDRLRPRYAPANGHFGFLAVYGSPKTIAPEQVRGKQGDARADVYAFGAMLYELLSGKPVFPAESPAEAAFAHLTQKPEPPSAKAPRGWVSKEVDAFVLSLLAKDPTARPKDAAQVLDAIEGLGRAPAAKPAPLPQEKIDELVDLLVAEPSSPDAAMALEKAVDQAPEPAKVAEAFAIAADQIEVKSDDDKETKKSLLYRAARIFDGQKDKARAEDMYEAIVQLDADDDIAQVALEEVRKALGKHEEIVEMLLARSEKAPPGEARARVYADIARIYQAELEDAEQALVAYTQSICEDPGNSDTVAEIESLAGTNAQRWQEVLSSVTEGVKNEALSPTDRNALLALAGRWYDGKLGRADMALMAFQQIMVTEPSSDAAAEGMANIYRKAQQWPELASALTTRAAAAGASPKGRDLRFEAAEIFEAKLGDEKKARDVYSEILAEDPGHAKAGDALARLAEKAGDFKTLVGLLEKRAEARRGAERVEILARVAEVYEDHLSDLPESIRRYEAVLAAEPTHLGALKGLDRIYNRLNRYKELLEVLEKQVSVAATPRQKINLYDRMAALYDEEFLDHAKAAHCLEQILAMDPAHDGAMTGLARHYRALEKWEEVVKLYEKHAAVTSDEDRRVELTLARGRVLAEQVGSPERAMRAYESVLEARPGHAGALEALARLKEQTGDAHAALSAIEALAAKAQSPEQKAEQWIRAAKLLESRGDKDSAIERYKLALEASPKDATAAGALRAAYAARGDVSSVVTLLEKELVVAEGNMAKARLYAELAKLTRNHLKDDAKAEQAAKKAFELDATNADAQLVLGDIAFDAARLLEASKYYETLVGRSAVLAKDDAVRVLVRFIESVGKTTGMTGSTPGERTSEFPAEGPTANRLPSPKIAVAVEALQKLNVTEPEMLMKTAAAVFEWGDPATARRMYEELLDRYGAKMVGSDRSAALYGLGESARRTGDLDFAVKPLRAAADADASNPKPLRSLAKIFEAKEDWREAVRIRQRRLEMAVGAERFDLLLEIGDLQLNKQQDRSGAQKTYAMALEERPDDRKVLTRLMQLYSDTKDWTKLVEIVLRLADFVEDKKQRAKYMHTAAIVSARQIGDVDQAIAFYDRALENDPSLSKAIEESLELRRQKSDWDGVEKMLRMQLDRAKEAQDRVAIPKILDHLAELYQKFLNEPEMAIEAYEAATPFDPDNKERAETLAELYASDVTQYLDKAVKSQALLLQKNPYRVESYKLLRHLYTEAKRPDAAWCLCQALAVLNLAEPDEERFYRRHRSDNAAAAQAALGDEDWGRLAHEDQDPILTRIFALVQPVIIRSRTQPLEALGYSPQYAIDPALHPYPVSQTLYYVQGVLGMQSPPIFQNTNDPSGLGFIHAHVPAIVLGRAAFETQVPTQSLAFVAGRHLTYYRPGYYVRHLVPTGTGLKAWLFAAIKLSVPQFPVAPDLSGQVQEAITAMQANLPPAEREKLASLVSKLLNAGAALDLKKWVASIDLTADRAGFLLAHDLAMATEVMRATEDASSVPPKERMKEVVLFSVSEAYFGIRDKLGISVEQ